MVEWPPRFTKDFFYKITRQQWDARINGHVPFTFYIRIKQGRRDSDDRIYILGVKNELTSDYQEFAYTDAVPLMMYEGIFMNEIREKDLLELLFKANLFYKKLKKLYTERKEKGELK